jgi:hypothetical protein
VKVPLTDDEFIQNKSQIATLVNVDALLECSLDDINENYLRKYSFGQELLTTTDHIVKTYFPHVKFIALYDTSYLPCNRAAKDTFDLLTYSIALYGATWYELKRNAYILDNEDWTFYKNKIAHYISKKYKSSIPEDVFMRNIRLSSNIFAQDFLSSHYEEISNLYKNTQTFPDFFQGLRNMIPFSDRCAFFKGWLSSFIGINKISRDWQYDLYTMSTTKQTVSGGKRYTRRNTKRRHL